MRNDNKQIKIDNNIYKELKEISEKIQSKEVLNPISLSSKIEKVSKYFKNKKKEKDKILEKFWNEELSRQFSAPICANFADGWKEEDIIKKAMLLSIYLRLDGLKSSQLRKFLDLATNVHNLIKYQKHQKNLHEEILPRIIKMRYILAYQAGKERTVEKLYAVLDPMLQILQKADDNNFKKNFGKFYEFLQAIVAYHKFFGGAD
ncbi:type III-A CRISPR-associated protein Csm2 [Methanotorris igneus]|uniref:CRISPR system Cms protein Csm2 n=1 Tax=Methanotorris igneus (strain DSM 5666 / JCM 11834 / Kol 5) TaxID=880724 RepID=F6BES9_METIK|nr:type III-A CRISPR-associated protein Csm2 [Methanotorris igneus]AEF96876.1 CRISPR-associated protein TM1810 domain protein [Methanotorris igneus Kol 5]